MGENSKIEWTDSTFNAWWGCVKVSAECDNCYAERHAVRYGFSEGGNMFPIWGKDTARRGMSESYWKQPMKWNRKAADAGKRHRVFCASYADVMEDHTPNGSINIADERRRLFDLVDDTQWLDWLLLTKRPQNFRRYLPADWLQEPRRNVWLGTTVGVKKSLWRVDELRNTPAAVRFLSIEPLLEDLGKIDLTGIHWVIVGGESGPGARPMHPAWARSVRDQCAAAGVPFFFKQNGEWVLLEKVFDYYTYGRMVRDNSDFVRQLNRYRQDNGAMELRCADLLLEGVKSSCIKYNHAAIGRVGKKTAGRMLDGREWNEFPKVAY